MRTIKNNANAPRLLHELNEGSMDAFEQFYEQYSSLVFHIALKMMNDRMEAEDICHDVFLEAFRKADQFDSKRGSLEAWLAVKTRSRCLDRMRRQKRTICEDALTDMPTAIESTTPEEHVIRRLDEEHLYEAIQQIPKTQRETLIGFYYESQTQQQIAQKMNYPLGTVKSLIRYGIQNIRKHWNGNPLGSASKEGRKHE
ncbi:sigma-70 family RNA polymerase sigma factor [Paenibacillus arenosi]|uniref:Sigma-70 family RNA polymerase sigma factor n=1 Tax=Paenibacillus arenosi TaxID=2774142 RepID=A0ABR9B406_9BACL|nr:sigma-70 family RNA polymerase sigma factor [Paenibacillus arenosi]